MNVKKMFAAATGVLMLAQLAPVAVLGAASYGAELEGAYKYAFEKGITTMSSIDSANMYGEITRGQLAKMISNWAEAELGQKADATKVCSFTDEMKAEGDLAMYVKKACQMGLMGQGIAAFRPNDKVTRGEFGTTLSRALWGDKYNTTANPYYVNHLAALKDAGIMTRTENPNSLEIRGYVMLMLQRAVASKNAANCADPVIALACKLGGENCPASCKEDKTVDNSVVKAGDLKVTATAATNRRILAGTSSDLDTVTFMANENITLDKVVLERYGYSTKNNVENVWLEDANGKVVAAKKGLNSNDEVTLIISKDSREIGKNATFTIVADVAGDALNKTIGFKVKSVESSAKNLDLSNYTPFTYDVVNYEGGKVQVTMRAANRTYNYAEGVLEEVARMQLKPTGASVLLKGFSLQNVQRNDALDLRRHLDKVEVIVGDKTVSNLKHEFDREDKLVLSFDAVELPMKKNLTVVVKASFTGLRDLPRSVKLAVTNKSDISAMELKNQARVSFVDLAEGGVYKFHGAQIKFSNTKISSSIDANAGSKNVVIASGRVEVGAVVSASTLTFEANHGADLIEDMYLVVGGDSYDAHKDGNKFVFRRVDFDRNASIQIKVDVKDSAAQNQKISFSSNLLATTLTAGGAKYEESRDFVEARDILGSISLSTIVVREAKGALDNTLTKTANVIANESTSVTLFDGTYTAKKQDVILNTYGITGTAALQNGEYVTFHLFLNGTEVSTMKLTNDAIGETNTFSDLRVKQGEKVAVKVVADAYLAGTNSYNFNLGLFGENEDGKAAGSDTAALVKVSASANGKVNLSDTVSNRYDAIVKSSNQVLATFVVKPVNSTDTVRLDSLKVAVKKDNVEMTKQQLLDNKFQVKVNGVGYDLDDETFEGNLIKVENINELLEGKGVNVDVISKTALDKAVYEVVLSNPNGDNKSISAKKKVVDALVRFVKMEDLRGDTRYTLSVSKYDNEKVSDVTLFYMENQQEKSVLLGNADESVEGERIFTTPAINDENHTITKVTFKVDGDTETITKAELTDYFTVGGIALRIYRS